MSSLSDMRYFPNLYNMASVPYKATETILFLKIFIWLS